MSQNTRAVQNDEKAYTSPSTAENQNVSLHVYTNAPHKPEPRIAMVFGKEISVASSATTRRLAKWVMLQNKNSIVPALRSADIVFTQYAASDASPPAKFTKNLAASINIGLPGG